MQLGPLPSWLPGRFAAEPVLGRNCSNCSGLENSRGILQQPKGLRQPSRFGGGTGGLSIDNDICAGGQILATLGTAWLTRDAFIYAVLLSGCDSNFSDALSRFQWDRLQELGSLAGIIWGM